MAKTVLGKLQREQRQRDVTDPVLVYMGGRHGKLIHYCAPCGPRNLVGAVPVRLSDFVAHGCTNVPCDHCGQLLLRA